MDLGTSARETWGLLIFLVLGYAGAGATIFREVIFSQTMILGRGSFPEISGLIALHIPVLSYFVPALGSVSLSQKLGLAGMTTCE